MPACAQVWGYSSHNDRVSLRAAFSIKPKDTRSTFITWEALPSPASRAAEYEALKADTAGRGVLLPVQFGADPQDVLKGHHRVKIYGELGTTDHPRIYRKSPG